MSYVAEEDRLEIRASVIASWFDWLEDLYESLLSRRTELESTSGFDPSPEMRPCEHRLQWRRGKLCIACDNTGWRPLTKQERNENLGIDPYATEVKRGITIVKDEGPAEKKARESQRLDRMIDQLQREEMIRDGVLAQSTPMARVFSIVGKKPKTLKMILRGAEYLRRRRPGCDLRSRESLLFLAAVIPGKLTNPPEGT